MTNRRTNYTETQLSGLYAYHQNKECPACKERRFKVLEVRKVVEGFRRRYKCDKCDYRQTMFEINQEAYDELRSLRSKLTLVQNAVLDLPRTEEPITKAAQIDSSASSIPCSDCMHITPYGCSFDIPEAQTEEAKGCNLFRAIV